MYISNEKEVEKLKNGNNDIKVETNVFQDVTDSVLSNKG